MAPLFLLGMPVGVSGPKNTVWPCEPPAPLENRSPTRDGSAREIALTVSQFPSQEMLMATRKGNAC